MAFKLSPLQQKILDFVGTGRGSAIVEAVAGGAKTTTLVMAAERIPTNLAGAVFAFNVTIKNEIAPRLPKHVRAMTLNGYGHLNWTRANKGVQVDANKTRNICRTLLTAEEGSIYGAGVQKLVALAKAHGVVPHGAERGLAGLVRDTDDFWWDMLEQHSIEFDAERAHEEHGFALARKVLAKSIELGRTIIDYDDQIYLPVITGAKFWQNDIVFVDEAQDVNRIQRAMLRRALRPNGRLIAVGDPHQAIYGFRGADTESLSNIQKEFNCVRLPLSVSYRCPKAVVREAQKYVSHISSAPSAPEGKVVSHGPWTTGNQKRVEGVEHIELTGADAIICRKTAPLVSTAFKLLRRSVPCRVLGREIGAGIEKLIDQMKAKTLESLEEKLDAYFEREKAKLDAKGKEDQIDALADKVESVHTFVQWLDEDQRTVQGLKDRIARLFNDNGAGLLTLCTVHKSKGLEWPRVFILDPELMPSKFARQDWQMEQEVNLQYVAVTRAKAELHYIGSDNLQD